jgi:hypothetical protein
MRRVILLVLPLVLLTGCAEPAFAVKPYAGTANGTVLEQPKALPVAALRDDGGVQVILRDNGVSVNTEVRVSNFHEGGRAEMVYHVTNLAGKELAPDFYVVPYADITDYSQGTGYEKATPEQLSWVSLPPTAPIAPNATEDYVIAIEAPKGADINGNFGLQIGVAGKSKAQVQMAGATWWLIGVR